ncbi:MAG: hypothetical protein ACREEE_05270 [Dongiaceae bacterium]
MNLLVGRSAQRNDAKLKPARFKRPNLLGYEGFGKARIPFEDEGNWTVQDMI